MTKRVKRFLFTCVVALIACLFVIEISLSTIFTAAYAGQFTVFERTYIRESGTPQKQIDTFKVINPQTAWKLQAFNGGMEDGETEYEKVSSATLNINGAEVLRANQFNQNTYYIEEVVKLSSGNSIAAELRSKPGGRLIINIVGEDSQSPGIAWTSPDNGSLFNTKTVKTALNLNDDISGINPQSLHIYNENNEEITARFNPFTEPALSVTLWAELMCEEGHHALIARAADCAGQQAEAAITFTVDVTPPVIESLYPEPESTITQTIPVISAVFSDNVSGIDLSKVKLILDGIEITAGININDSSLEYIPEEPLSYGTHNVEVKAADLCANTASKSSSFTIKSPSGPHPEVRASSGFIHARVFDSNTEAPISAVTVTADGISGELLTDGEGKVCFPTDSSGMYTLIFSKDGYINSERTVYVVSKRDVSAGIIYMKQLDPAMTTITNSGGVHINAAGTLQFNFPANALPPGVESIDVRATLYEKGRELPSPLPRSTAFTYAFDAKPDQITFNQPISCRLANSRGFAPGTPIPIGYYNPDTHKWEDTGRKGIVSADGGWVDFQITHFSPYDINLPATVRALLKGKDQTKSNNIVSANCVKDFGNSTVFLKAGELLQEHTLPAYHALVQEFTLNFTYNSRTANPAALLSVETELNSAVTTIPDTTSLKYSIEGREEEIHYEGVNGKTIMSYLFDATNARGEPLDTGSYPYELEAANNYTDLTFATADFFGGPATGNTGILIPERVPMANTFKGRVSINNQQDSLFGSGWSLSGLQRLHVMPDNALCVSEGDSSVKTFTKQTSQGQHLVVDGRGFGDVSIALNNSDATFQNPVEYPTPDLVYYTEAAAPGDFNQDGFSDLAVIRRGGPSLGSQVLIMLGKGDGSFQEPLTYQVWVLPTDIIAEDFNQDGITDLALPHYDYYGKVSILLGNGDGTFQNHVWNPASGYLPYMHTVDCADFNNDGIPDLVADISWNCVSTLLGNGDGSFRKGGDYWPLPWTGYYVQSVIAEDFNQDGFADIAATVYNDSGNGTLAVLLGKGNATFESPIRYWAGFYPGKMVSDDFNQDGIADLAVANYRSGSFVVLLGNGDASFQAPVSYQVGGNYTNRIISGDFNIDGVTDLAISITKSGSDNTVIMIGKGDGTFVPGQNVLQGINCYLMTSFNLTSTIPTPSPKNTYVSSNGDYTYITKNPDNTYTRVYKDGTKINFNSLGLQTEIIDTNANTITYEYSDINNDGLAEELTSIILPTTAKYNFTYDGNAKLLNITDPANRVTGFDIDSYGDLRRIINPDNTIIKFSYGQRHLMTEKTDERGFTTEYDYNGYGMITQIRSPEREIYESSETGTVTAQRLRETRDYIPSNSKKLSNDLPFGTGTQLNPAQAVRPNEITETLTDAKGITWTYQTDKFGGRKQFTDPLGNITRYERDSNSNLRKLVRANGSERNLTYDSRGNLIKVRESYNSAITTIKYHPQFSKPAEIKDAKGNKTYISYDAKANPITITNSKGVITQIEYNSRGQIIRIINAFGKPEQSETRFEYDSITFNLSKAIDPLNRETLYSYDQAGNVIEIIDAEHNRVKFTYDEMNRVKTSIDADNQVTAYEYYDAGYLKSVTDANQQTTAYYYDEQGQLIKTVNALGKEKKFGYDANRNLSQVVTAKGDVIKFYYDQANLLRTKFLSGRETGLSEEEVVYDYDSVYNLTDISDNDSSLNFEYDPLSRLITANTNPGFSQPETAISYAYDLNDNRLSMAGPQGEITNYVYDTLNLLTAIKDGTGIVLAAFEYDALNRRRSKTMPMSIIQSSITGYNYDNAGQLLSLTQQPGNLNYAYTYDNVGNRTSMNDSDGQHSYIYDNLYRLTTANHPNISAENYSYDALGNRNSLQYNYDAGNRLLENSEYTYNYDDNGNMISRRKKSNNELTTYAYDCENRLVKVTAAANIVEYAYDAIGRRIAKNIFDANRYPLNAARYVYDGDDIIAEYDGNGVLIGKYIYGPGIDEPVCTIRYTLTANRYYYHADGLGSIVALTDEAGNVAESYEYDVYGQVKILDANRLPLSASQIGNSYMFTGRELDSETGLYYYRARYYDPQIGRFLQEDPVWGTNLYSYVDNNPVNFIDPYGLQSAVPNIFGPNSGHLGTETPLVNIPWLDIAKNINRESGIESCGIGASIGLELGVGKSYSEKGGKTENKRRVSTKKEFLRSIIDKSPKWMKQWLRKGKNPPGYHVHHQKPLYKGGSDAIENMRLIDIDMHKIITAIWRGMR